VIFTREAKIVKADFRLCGKFHKTAGCVIRAINLERVIYDRRIQ
jgi:hypothetical protein